MDQNHQRIIVSGVLLNQAGEVFLTKRPLTKTIAPGKYHLPGGHVDFGEAPEEALIREFAEEFGYRSNQSESSECFRTCMTQTIP